MKTKLWKQSYRLPNNLFVISPTIFKLWVMKSENWVIKFANSNAPKSEYRKHHVFLLTKQTPKHQTRYTTPKKGSDEQYHATSSNQFNLILYSVFSLLWQNCSPTCTSVFSLRIRPPRHDVGHCGAAGGSRFGRYLWRIGSEYF